MRFKIQILAAVFCCSTSLLIAQPKKQATTLVKKNTTAIDIQAASTPANPAGAPANNGSNNTAIDITNPAGKKQATAVATPDKAATAAAKPKNELMDEMLLLRLRRLGEVVASPDGKTLIFTLSTPDFATNKSAVEVYSMLSGGSEPKRIIDKAYNPASAKFRPDGKKIGFLSAKNGTMQLWECDLDGSNLKAASSNAIEDIDGFKYSPDGKKIAFFKTVQIEKTIKQLYPDLTKVSEDARIIDGLNYRHWKTWEDGAYSHVFITDYTDGKMDFNKAHDLMIGEAYDAPNPPDNGEEDLVWSPDSKFLVYACKKETGTAYAVSTDVNLYCYDLTTDKTTNLTATNKGYDQQPSFSPDGAFLAWQSMERAGYESDKNRVMVAPCAQGKLGAAIEVTKSIDLTSAAYAWSNNSKGLYMIMVERGTKQLYSVDYKGNNLQPLTRGQYDYNALNVVMSNGREQIAGTRCSMEAPADLYLINPSILSENEARMTFLNKDLLEGIKTAKVEKRMVKTTDGQEELCWVIYPPDFDATKKYPTLLYCQGGPQSPVSQFWSYRWNFQLMASKGYIIIAPNRRGLQGFGQTWNDAIQADYGGQCMKDLLSASDDIAKEAYVDKDRMGAIGASFGGYSVYWLMGNHQKRFKTFIAHCGMFNMESWYGTTEEMFFANHDQKGAYWENPSAYTSSPHRFVNNWDTPILVIHNEKDFRVPLGEGMQAFTAAQLKGIKSRFLYLPDEGHHVSKPQNGILWQRTFYDWLGKTLK